MSDNEPISIKGLQEAQAAAVKALEAVKPRGAFGRAVQYVLAGAHRYAAAITVVDTGSWRASHKPVMNEQQLHGRLFIDPNAVNPFSKSRPSVYGAILESRGGRYAVYATTEQKAGPALLEEGGRIIREALP